MNNRTKIIKLSLAVAALLLAFNFRMPELAAWGNLMFWLILIISFGLIISEVIAFRKTYRRYRRKRRHISFLILAIAWLSLCSATTSQVKFLLSQNSTPEPQPTPVEIVSTPTYKVEVELEQKLEEKPREKPVELGSHIIIGYRSFPELKKMVAEKAVAGVFITDKNVRYKSKEQIKKDIATLQEIRRTKGLPPLWVAADQEGGMVSRLSPPLTRLPSLGRIIDDDRDLEQQKDKIIEYATTQAKELSEIGVNLNFSPVVDLNKGIRNPRDRHSKIYRRAISDDKEVVAKVALWYCQTLEKYGVKCTIKHFPGLGRVSTDTHVAEANLGTSVEELTNDDWVPFREVMKNSQAFTMLGHAKLTAVDAENAASFSKKVVDDITRQRGQQRGRRDEGEGARRQRRNGARPQQGRSQHQPIGHPLGKEYNEQVGQPEEAGEGQQPVHAGKSV